ncbi:MAG TPA: NIPSNAP family protein [Bryobacteraceae bacterium]|nr:NIPSNAP family protein [Bryobacteraceae bacterium]
MRRRHFLASVAGAAILPPGVAAAEDSQREYYELRRYKLRSGSQTRLIERYLADALIPALNRLGMKPIGAFNLDLGPETPTLYLLIPSSSPEALVNAELRLAADDQYNKSGEPFLTAPAKEPPFERIESSLMIAFEGWPKLVVPPVTAQKGKRVFQLRTYESPSIRDHRVKVEMFHNGEFEVFRRAGFWQVFYGDKLLGERLPNLTYMLSFPSVAEMDAKWNAFRADPEWKKLSSNPKFSFESIVTNISNLILSPTSYSQI